MKFNPNYHHRRSIRLPGYDYSSSGVYFITICTPNRECLFGNVMDGNMVLNKWGVVVRDEWIKTGQLRLNIILDEYIIMPNHVHVIVILRWGMARSRGTARRAPTDEKFGNPIPGSIPTIIRSFKSAVTRRINQIRKTPGATLWQRNYFERVIRNKNELVKTKEYIQNNPILWVHDSNHPKNLNKK